MNDMYLPYFPGSHSKLDAPGHHQATRRGRSVIHGEFLRLRDMIDRIEQMSLENSQNEEAHVEPASDMTPEGEFESGEYVLDGISDNGHVTAPLEQYDAEAEAPTQDDSPTAFDHDDLVGVHQNGHHHGIDVHDPLDIYAVDYTYSTHNGNGTSHEPVDPASWVVPGYAVPDPIQSSVLADAAEIGQDEPAWHSDNGAMSTESDESESDDVDSSEETADAGAGRWWINFNGELSLSRIAKMRARLQESPFVIEAQFELIENGLIHLRVVTGGLVTTVQMDWVLQQMLEALELDRNCAVLSPQ